MFPQRLSTSFRLLLYMYSSFDDQFDEPQSSFKGVRIQVYEITTVHHCESTCMRVRVVLRCISRGAARPRVLSVHEKKRASHGIIYLGS